jgi:hypothetical protein
MTLDLARAILDDAKDTGVRDVRFFLAGEPLLHPELPEMVERAVHLGLHTVVHTNATRLTSEIGRKLIQAGLHDLSFSFDGQNAEEYEAIHRGAEFKTTLEKITVFLEVKKSLKSASPVTTLQILQVSGDRSNGLRPEFTKLFKGLPLDKIRLLPPFTWPEQEADGFAFQRGKRFYPCQPLWQSVSIGWDGTYLGCCGDLNHLWSIGHFPEQKIRDVWNGEAMTEARKRMRAKNVAGLPLCHDCSAAWRNHHPFFSDLRDIISAIRCRLGGAK